MVPDTAGNSAATAGCCGWFEDISLLSNTNSILMYHRSSCNPAVLKLQGKASSSYGGMAAGMEFWSVDKAQTIIQSSESTSTVDIDGQTVASTLGELSFLAMTPASCNPVPVMKVSPAGTVVSGNMRVEGEVSVASIAASTSRLVFRQQQPLSSSNETNNNTFFKVDMPSIASFQDLDVSRRTVFRKSEGVDVASAAGPIQRDGYNVFSFVPSSLLLDGDAILSPSPGGNDGGRCVINKSTKTVDCYVSLDATVSPPPLGTVSGGWYAVRMMCPYATAAFPNEFPVLVYGSNSVVNGCRGHVAGSNVVVKFPKSEVVLGLEAWRISANFTYEYA